MGARAESERGASGGARRARGERVGSEWGAREEWWRVREGGVGGEREGSEARASGESGGEGVRGRVVGEWRGEWRARVEARGDAAPVREFPFMV